MLWPNGNILSIPSLRYSVVACRPGGLCQGPQNEDRTRLEERIVAVSALRRLDAGGTSGFALALLHRLGGGLHPASELMETLFRETRATRVSVIDKDGGQAGVLVQHRGYPTDVPAVTRRN